MPKRNGSGIALLADETRRRIVAMVAIRPRRPSSIAAELGLSRSATSRQLRLLKQAGLIRMMPFRADDRGSLYGIDPVAHGRITAWLAGTDVGLENDRTASVNPRKSDRPAWIRPSSEPEDNEPR